MQSHDPALRQAPVPTESEEVPHRSWRRWPIVASLVLIVSLAAGGTSLRLGLLPLPAAAQSLRLWSHPAAARPSQNLSTVTVAQRDLASKERVNGTLGYGDPRPVLNQYSPAAGSRGFATALPSPGQVISQGQQLYALDGRSIPLFYGDQPFWRQLTTGVSGHDVQELEQNLIALGFANSSNLATDGNFTADDAAAVKRWQAALGVTQTGVFNPGDVVLQPGAVRVQDVKANLGAAIGPGAQVMDVTSTTRQIEIDLDASLQSLVKVGDPVDVSLPGSNQSTTGKVTAIGSVATPTQSNGGSSNQSSGSPQATVKVFVSLDNPAATGTLDHAPVSVSITSQQVKGVLAVPINALLALQEGGYAVEVQDPNGKTHLVAVQAGLFDDQDSLVQISGTGIVAGTRVVVPQGL